MVLLPILVAGVTIAGSGSPSRSWRSEFIGPTKPALTLLDVATAAARRDSFNIGRTLGQRPRVPPRAYRTGHYSVATRASAIFAGAVLGSFAGMAAGGGLDKMTSGGECLTFMAYGIPVGAVIGGVLAGRAVQ
jgi:hypothetical protein